MSPGLHRIESVGNCRKMWPNKEALKDVHRLCLVRFFLVRGRFFTTNEPSEREPIGIDDTGRVGNDGGGRAVLEYGRETL